ncbi:MAG: 2-phospho-L-lactate guanylyltransferase [Candidatus Dormibacteria bacterium]|jgi:2-phospho-L-lactate guanylyltransferase
MRRSTWVVVLLKEFEGAKTRLSAVLPAADRLRLVEENAALALRAAQRAAPVLAVCGGPAAARFAARLGAPVLLENDPRGQNAAARSGLAEVARRGAEGCLLLSSDLPLVDASSLARVIERGEAVEGPVAVAVPAIGRQGTNALYLRPIAGFDLQFGDASLPRFAAEAERRGRTFVVHEEPALALDLDVPADLAALTRLRATA